MVGRNHVISNIATACAATCCVCAMRCSDGFSSLIGHKISEFFVPGLAAEEPHPFRIAVYAIAAAVLFLFGSLLPDVDSEYSTLGRHFYLPVRHRTLTHTAWVVIALLALSLNLRVFIWLTAGYFLHIFYDSLSTAGIAWFWPLSRYITYSSGATVKKGFRAKLYRTGESSETVVTYAICGFALLLIAASVAQIFVTG